MNKTIIIFFYLFANYSLCNASKEFIYSSINNNRISSEYFMYLEGLDEKANYDILKKQLQFNQNIMKLTII